MLHHCYEYIGIIKQYFWANIKKAGSIANNSKDIRQDNFGTGKMNISHPKSLDDITPEWLTSALSVNYSGTVVNSVRPSTIISGHATKARFELEYGPENNKHGLPSSLWVKSGFESHSKASAAGNRNEANFFRDIAPLIPGICPDSYYQSIDAKTGQGVVLLEDLLTRKVTFSRLTQPASKEQAAAVLNLQASYHAFFWDNPKLDHLEWLSNGGFILEDGIVDQFIGMWETSESLPRFKYVPDRLRDKTLIRHAQIQLLQTNMANARCLIHGDSHLGNLYFDPDGNPGYLDWQTVMHGYWAFDVCCFIVPGLTADVRRRNERELLAYYLHRLAHYGAKAPTFDDAWLAYRRNAMWAFMWSLCPTAYQSEENCLVSTERACAAIMDLETIESLGV